jgi:pyridoxine kinase
MQRLGREVWAVNTVEFSNHTGYGSWRGKVLGADLVSELVCGLEERGVLCQCDAVLSGYLGDGSVGRAVIEAVKKVKKENPAAIYCCDPVMGDTGRGFYVNKDIPGIFKNEVISFADILCPNQFELEALTDFSIKNINDARHAINLLHEQGPSIVLVTSFKEKDGHISMLASDKINLYKTTTKEFPLGDGIAGTGDLTASVFLSRFLENQDIKKTLELCTASIYGILERSYNISTRKKGKLLELKIIEAQQQLCSPDYSFEAEKI